jgi:succinate-acetate transporter protein
VTQFAFVHSAFIPVAIGFFGLGTGYFVWGGQAVFGVPKPTPEVNRTMGMWGFWMPGFMQLITGVYLMVGLSWFNVYGNAAPLYMAALAFTAYGVHWFAMAHRRFIGSSDQPDAWMAIPFALISILGITVFVGAHDAPLVILFVGLTLIYLTEIPGKFAGSAGLARLTGLWQLLTGIWLMYLTYATAINLSLGVHWWL